MTSDGITDAIPPKRIGWRYVSIAPGRRQSYPVTSRAVAGESPQVDVVVPLFRPGRWLETCVESVIGSQGTTVSVWLIDDDPTSRLASVVADR